MDNGCDMSQANQLFSKATWSVIKNFAIALEITILYFFYVCGASLFPYGKSKQKFILRQCNCVLLWCIHLSVDYCSVTQALFISLIFVIKFSVVTTSYCHYTEERE